jgi:hypothetical protein
VPGAVFSASLTNSRDANAAELKVGVIPIDPAFISAARIVITDRPRFLEAAYRRRRRMSLTL